MNKEEEIVEIEEFDIVDIKDIKKNKTLQKLLTVHEVEPFSKSFNKTIYTIGHSLEAIYFVDKCWFIETRSYDPIAIPITKFIYRWRFTQTLPKKLLKIIPLKTLRLAKTTLVMIHPDTIIEMPTMGGKVETILATDGTTKLYYITNPEIMS